MWETYLCERVACSLADVAEMGRGGDAWFRLCIGVSEGLIRHWMNGMWTESWSREGRKDWMRGSVWEENVCLYWLRVQNPRNSHAPKINPGSPGPRGLNIFISTDRSEERYYVEQEI